MELLRFEMGLEFQEEVVVGNFSAGLRKVFENHGLSLSSDITISVQEQDRVWHITDNKQNQRYIVSRDKNGLVISPASMRCVWMTEKLLRQYWKGELSQEGETLIDEHLDKCGVCSTALRQLAESKATFEPHDARQHRILRQLRANYKLDEAKNRRGIEKILAAARSKE